MKKQTISLTLITLLVYLLLSCKGEKSEDKEEASNPKGIGPVQEITLGDLDPALAKKGSELFEAKCTACHKIEERYVGPALKGVTERRQPEWVMNMILNPAEMTQKDSTAQELLATYMTQMTNQHVSEEDARAILEFFRQNDQKAAAK